MRYARILATGAAAAALSLAATSGQAQDYPSQPIQIVVAAGAGGGTDVLVRTLQPYLEEELGGTIVVINVPGSGSVGGSRRVYEAEPDGYTVLANHVTLLTAMALGNAEFTPADFETAAAAVAIPLVTVTPANRPYQNLDDLMADAREEAESVIAGVNIGAVNHFTMLMLQALAEGVEFRFVQTGGGAATTAALLGEHIDVGVLAGSEARAVAEEGSIRVLAALGDDRISYFPDVATAREQGYDMSLGVEYFWLMPDGTPADRVEAFGAAIEAAVTNPEVIAELEQMGMIPTYSDSEAAREKMDSLFETMSEIAATLE